MFLRIFLPCIHPPTFCQKRPKADRSKSTRCTINLGVAERFPNRCGNDAKVPNGWVDLRFSWDGWMDYDGWFFPSTTWKHNELNTHLQYSRMVSFWRQSSCRQNHVSEGHPWKSIPTHIINFCSRFSRFQPSLSQKSFKGRKYFP